MTMPTAGHSDAGPAVSEDEHTISARVVATALGSVEFAAGLTTGFICLRILK
jgi:hypothetical protein